MKLTTEVVLDYQLYMATYYHNIQVVIERPSTNDFQSLSWTKWSRILSSFWYSIYDNNICIINFTYPNHITLSVKILNLFLSHTLLVSSLLSSVAWFILLFSFLSYTLPKISAQGQLYCHKMGQLALHCQAGNNNYKQPRLDDSYIVNEKDILQVTIDHS